MSKGSEDRANKIAQLENQLLVLRRSLAELDYQRLELAGRCNTTMVGIECIQRDLAQLYVDLYKENR